jgi:hypothetical protein
MLCHNCNHDSFFHYHLCNDIYIYECTWCGRGGEDGEHDSTIVINSDLSKDKIKVKDTKEKREQMEDRISSFEDYLQSNSACQGCNQMFVVRDMISADPCRKGILCGCRWCSRWQTVKWRYRRGCAPSQSRLYCHECYNKLHIICCKCDWKFPSHNLYCLHKCNTV